MSFTYSAGGAMPLPTLAWDFNGTTTDYVSRLTGTTTGTVSYNASGKYGQSLVITNTTGNGFFATNYVSYTTSIFPSTLTVMTWIKFNVFDTATDPSYFFEFTGGSSPNGIKYAIALNTSKKFEFRTGNVTSGGNIVLSSPGPVISTGQWNHVAAILDGSNQTIYVNGVLVATGVCDTSGLTYNNVRLGGHSGLQRKIVDGELDDLRIFDRALTSAQVQSIYNQQGVPGRGALQNVVGSSKTTLTGTPLFSQLSSGASSSAVGAFSLRAVNGTSAKAVNVRNGTTSATQDFYADRLGNLLTAPVVGQSLAKWLGGATGYVATWYDQSGAGNHATQTTAANQPIIQRATKGPGYMCLFNGTTNYLTGMSYTVLNATNFSFNVVERRTGSTSGGTATNDLTLVSCGDVGATGKLLYLTYRNSTTSLFGSWSPELSSTISAFTSASTEPIRYTSATASSTSGRRVYIYNDPLGNPITTTNATQTSLMSMTSGNFQIGYYNFGSSTSYYKGEIYEVLVFTNSLYDLDNTGGLITQIYNNQLGYTGT
ncbi:virion structural protein [Yellowstone lake phycodnavirus 1]|uniref:virion structural protein n=1 Tax=Yellowstone lake phycodnavirus 1 TaxID=1586713 RepID=UPI0006EB3514|nr:virion structural protein [Yellowstone lake phycodnavirus 1]BAT22190.1 hypothetical protein [Yellowstone lake phycodnavirus 1]